MFTETYKNIKNFASEIFKRNISGKLDVEEATHIEGYVDTKIKDGYNLTHPKSPVYYTDILLPIKKYTQGKNECYTFRNIHSGRT